MNGKRDGRLGIEGSRQRPGRSFEPPLGLLEPAPREDAAAEREVGGSDDRVVGPAEPVGELDRLAAARLGQLRLLLQVRHVREEAEAGDGDVRSSCAPCELEALAEVALCRVELHGPQLHASDADQRDRAQIVDVGPDLAVRAVEERLGRARDRVEVAARCDRG